ncbi:STAS domain-containing protein [Streptomyces pathocidini]|uniref:STAS domain-containing protein n=1 Tax=Streptomyces pathocidini TaxID=1650571 RepID=UPI0033E0C207
MADHDERGPMELTIGGRLAPADVPRLCARLCELVGQAGPGGGAVTLDVGGLAEPDMVAVEALARLQLTARRLGRRVQLRGTTRELRALLVSSGLEGVVRECPGLRLEVGGETEEGEEPRGVEE